ncbi:MAG: hypothetical protein EOM37_10365 [Proteobacteria bacterium]|nr:hypothetical protein [Pseudomonadota bacterium]
MPTKQYFIIVFILVILFCVAANVFAEVKTTSKKIRAKGYGTTPQEAVQDALVQVVQQHKGVRIDATQVQQTIAGSFSEIHDGEESSKAMLRDAVQKHVATKTQGDIGNYAIIDQGVGTDGLNWAEVEATFTTSAYVAPGLPSDKRRRIAIYPFNTESDAYYVSGQNVPGPKVADAVTDAITAQLVQTRKFAVLQRRDMSAFTTERALLLSAEVGKAERLKLGQLLGVDYMLTGVVTGFRADTAAEVSALTGEKLSGGNAEILMSYELMLMATQEIKWADTVAFNISLPHNAAEQTALAQSFDALGNKIVMDLLENIYPPLIIAVNGMDLQLNIGGKSYAPGDTLDVYSLGASVIDPYTKESLGRSEQFVASVVVTRVTPKTTYARISEKGNIAVGMICRRQEVRLGAVEKGGKEKTDVQIIQGGGVKLPFD